MMERKMWDCGYVAFPMADGSLQQSSQEHCKPLFEALVGLAKSNSGTSADFAAGTRLDQKGQETIYVEHKWAAAHYARVEFRPSKVRASVANAALGNQIERISDLSQIAAAVWYAYIAFDMGKQFSGIEKITQKLDTGIEEDEVEAFELELTNFEAKAMIAQGPITGAEDTVPVLDKKVKGPQKIISGKFVTFPNSGTTVNGSNGPLTRAAIEPYILTGEKAQRLRERTKKNPALFALSGKPKESHQYSEQEVYAYKCFKDSEEDEGDLSVHVMQVTGPAAAGKSEFGLNFAYNNGFAFGSVTCNESTRIMDLIEDKWVPYIERGKVASFTEVEQIVNDALKADTEGRDALAIAREALDYPSALEVRFDPSYAWEMLGETGPAKSVSEINSLIDAKANEILTSLKKKIENSDTSNAFLSYKLVPSIFRLLFENGGVLEMGEAATMRKGELSKLHDYLDFNRDAYLETADGLVKRNEAFYVIFTNNLEYDEDHPMTIPMISRMALDIEFPQLSEEAAVDRLCSVLHCENKRCLAKEIVHAYLAIGKEAANLSLPGGLDFRNLKQIGNRIINHDYDPREVFEREVIHHFAQHSDPESKTSDELALLGLLDELDLFR